MDNKLSLSIAVHGLNNAANPEGLTPILLVFGTIPKLPLGNIEHLCPYQRTRFQAMEIAKKDMEEIVAEQRLSLASKTRVKPMDVFGVCPGSKVLVYREKETVWEGPYKLFKYDDYKTAYVDTGKLIEQFSITAVKLYRIAEGETRDKVMNPGIGERVEVYWLNE